VNKSKSNKEQGCFVRHLQIKIYCEGWSYYYYWFIEREKEKQKSIEL